MAPAVDESKGRSVSYRSTLRLDLREIQGDLLIGMQKNAEQFIFFKINDVPRFKARTKEYLVRWMTNARTVQEREGRVEERRRRQQAKTEAWMASNLGFTRDGLTQLLGSNRPRLDPAFERGPIIRRQSQRLMTRPVPNGCEISSRIGSTVCS